jgi:ABC-type glycerol-3-phosphate transport system permease component
MAEQVLTERKAGFLTSVRNRRKLGLLLVALVVTFGFAFPLYMMLTTSFKAESEVLAIPYHWLPYDFQGISNYVQAFEIAPLELFAFNSIFMAVIDVIFTVFFSALVGYGFARFDFPGRRPLFWFVLTIIMIPSQILFLPLYIQVRSFGWDDSYAGLIIPGILNAFGVFMMRQFAFSIPSELLDAARIDGASEPGIFARIVFPLLAPAAASLAIIIFLFSWNNFLWPLIIVKSEAYRTLPLGMPVYTEPYLGQPRWAVAMAVSTLAVLPVAFLFIFFQRYFVEGIVMSGIKG